MRRMATLPFGDPRVNDLVDRQREDRESMKDGFNAINSRFDRLEQKIELRLDARKWTPAAWSVVLGPIVAAMVAVIGVLLAGPHS